MRRPLLALLFTAGCAVEPAPRVELVGPTPAGWVAAAEAWMPRIEAWRGRSYVRPVRIRRAQPGPDVPWGLYDAGSDVLTLALPAHLDPGSPVVATTLVHELAHALQDQHQELSGFATPDSDAGRARLALVEGEAMLTAAALVGFDVAAHQAAADASPEALATLFVYADGAAFVDALRAAGGWPAVDRAWHDPPESTAEVLAPHRYLAGQPVVAPDSLGGGQMAGAYLLRRMLAATPPGQVEGRSLASAWQGDAVRPHADRDGVSGMRWTVKLDGEAPAARLAAIAGPNLAQLPGALAEPAPRVVDRGDGVVEMWWATDTGAP